MLLVNLFFLFWMSKNDQREVSTVKYCSAMNFIKGEKILLLTKLSSNLWAVFSVFKRKKLNKFKTRCSVIMTLMFLSLSCFLHRFFFIFFLLNCIWSWNKCNMESFLLHLSQDSFDNKPNKDLSFGFFWQCSATL